MKINLLQGVMKRTAFKGQRQLIGFLSSQHQPLGHLKSAPC